MSTVMEAGFETTYVALFNAGPAYVPGGVPAEQPGLRDHVAYHRRMHEAGVVVLEGPLFVDDEFSTVAGAMQLIRAVDLSEARGVAAGDPLIEHGVLELATVRPFIVGVGKLS